MRSDIQTMVSEEYGTPDLLHSQKAKKRTPKKTSASANSSLAEWLIPTGLIFLSLVPAVGGSVRLAELGSGAEFAFLPDSERIASASVPVAIHIVSVIIYSILGAFQFAPGFRRRYRSWHRAAGRLLIPSGLVTALSGLWMTQFSPLPWHDIGPLYWVRLVVGLGMTTSIVLGVLAIRQRNFVQHGAWMIRAYALGLGAGTQVFVLLPWMFFPSIHSQLMRAILMALAWLINLAVAEWVIQKRRSRRASNTSSTHQSNPFVAVRA